ncbi:MAG TPA: hypothetical protein VFG51_02860 [Candidatus Saccharimonadia bacterium]|nr:hypothetical protein [Candidatus Saccharimonadia bacterium]
MTTLEEFELQKSAAIESGKKCIEGIVKAFPFLSDEELRKYLDDLFGGCDEQIGQMMREIVEERRIEWKERN